MDVLETMRAAGGSLGVTDIATEMGLAKSTVHRMLVAMGKKGVVRKDLDTDRYTFGPMILQLAHTASQQLDLVSFVKPFLEGLRDLFGETTALGLKVGLRYSYVVQVPSRQEHRVNPIMGAQYPLHWAATGKVILAYIPQDEYRQSMELVGQAVSTPATVTDVELLNRQLDEIRRLGYAVSFGERHAGSAAVTAPIRGRDGHAVAAICVLGPESRVRPMDLDAVGQKVAETARHISLSFQTLGLG
jgi:DNA-binding IclR family transcriptional regulator